MATEAANTVSDPGVSVDGIAAQLADVQRENESLKRRCAAFRQVIDLHAASLWRATPESVLKEVAVQAAKITGFRCAVIYEVIRDPEGLTVMTAFGVDGQVEGSRLRIDDGFAGRVVRSGKIEHLVGTTVPGDGFLIGGREYDRADGIPLHNAAGAVQWVLVVADHLSSRGLTKEDLGELEVFAEYAGLLVQISRLWTWDERRFGQTENIHRIENYMRNTSDPEKLLLALLTGVTAGFGLCYSRAAMFLRNAAGDAFEGRGAIGSLSAASAREVWEAENLPQIDGFFEALERDALPPGELDARVRAVSIPRTASPAEWLEPTLVKGFTVVDADTVRQHWPRVIVETFNPESSVLLIAIRTGEEIDGFVIADNAFLPGRVEDHARDASHLVRAGIKALHALGAESSTDQAEGEDRDNPLRDVYAQIVNTAMNEIFHGDRAALWLYDPHEKVFALRKYAGPDLPGELQWREPRLGGPLREAIQQGWVAVGDVEHESREFLSPDTREMLLGLSVHSFQAFAVSLGDQPLGVVCVGHTRPRTFQPGRDTYVAAAFGGRAALALRQAQLVERYRRARSAAGVLAHPRSLEEPVEAIQTMAGATLQALQCHAVMIHEFEHSTSDHHTRPVVALDRHAGDLVMAGALADAGAWLATASSDRTRPWEVNVADRRSRSAEGPLTSTGIRSAIVVPLIAGKERVGVLCVGHARPYRYTREEREDAQLFADQIAQVIRLRQLYRQIKANADLMSIGILNLNWKHRSGELAYIVENAVKSIRRALDQGVQSGDLNKDFRLTLDEYLDAISDSTPALREPPVKDHFRDKLRLVPINDFLRQWNEKHSRVTASNGHTAEELVYFDSQADQVRLECRADDTATVEVNERWLGEVLDELVSNARKHAPGSTITISTWQQGTEVHVECADTGPGMPEDKRRQVGRESVPSGTKNGMGLGLRLVHTIAMQYDGRFTAPDPAEPGSGAVFRVTLPLGPAAAK